MAIVMMSCMEMKLEEMTVTSQPNVPRSPIMDMAEMHVRSALFRTESRVLPAAIHYRVDYPEADDENWRKHTVLKREKGEIKISTRELKKLETFLREVDVDAC